MLKVFTESLIGQYITVFIVSMVPVLELRGGLLAASLLDIEMYKAVWICIIGNLIPIPFIQQKIRLKLLIVMNMK